MIGGHKQPAEGQLGPSNPIRVSKTMPQLNYTRADIQEQYLSSVKVRHDNLASSSADRQQANEAGRTGNRRAQSGEGRQAKRSHQFKTTKLNDENSSDYENDEPSEQDGDGARGRDRQRRRGRESAESKSDGQRKRSRRSQSASRLLAACFNIPSQLSSMLPAASSSASGGSGGGLVSDTKKSLLAHLGLGGSSSSGSPSGASHRHPATPGSLKRPISASQTADNLQQVSGGADLPASNQPGGVRKHVSFERERQAAAEAEAAVAAAAAAQPQFQRLGQPAEPRKQTSTMNSNVITRNYQTEQTSGPNSAQHQPPTSAMQTRQHQQQQQSPIYLVSQTQVVAGRQPCQQQSNQISQAISQVHQAPYYHGQPPTRPPAPINQYAPGQQQQPTIYKRLPVVPMKTQATQTEITAYHLMSTPPISAAISLGTNANTNFASNTTTATNSSSLVGGPDTPTTSAATQAPSSIIQTPTQLQRPLDAHHEDQARHRQPGEAKNSRNKQIKTHHACSSDQQEEGQADWPDARQRQPQATGTQAAVLSGPNEQLDELLQEDEDDLNASGSLLALSSGSNSSSSVSLVGHDTALADTLQCDLRIKQQNLPDPTATTATELASRAPPCRPPEVGAGRRPASPKAKRSPAGLATSIMIASVDSRPAAQASAGPPSPTDTNATITPSASTSSKSPRAECRPAKLKNDNDKRTKSENRFVAGAAPTGDGITTSGATSTMISNNNNIELPGPFKDEVREFPLAPLAGGPEVSSGPADGGDNDDAGPPSSTHNMNMELDSSNAFGDDDDVECDYDEAAEARQSSPPSLSEASSQTDPSLAATHILDRIERTLGGAGGGGGGGGGGDDDDHRATHPRVEGRAPRSHQQRRQFSTNDRQKQMSANDHRDDKQEQRRRQSTGAPTTTTTTDPQNLIKLAGNQQQQRSSLDQVGRQMSMSGRTKQSIEQADDDHLAHSSAGKLTQLEAAEPIVPRPEHRPATRVNHESLRESLELSDGIQTGQQSGRRASGQIIDQPNDQTKQTRPDELQIEEANKCALPAHHHHHDDDDDLSFVGGPTGREQKVNEGQGAQQEGHVEGGRPSGRVESRDGAERKRFELAGTSLAAEQRRDEFLCLADADYDQLMLATIEQVGLIEPQIAADKLTCKLADDTRKVAAISAHQQPPPSGATKTSTINTRHHSYCSNTAPEVAREAFQASSKTSSSFSTSRSQPINVAAQLNDDDDDDEEEEDETGLIRRDNINSAVPATQAKTTDQADISLPLSSLLVDEDTKTRRSTEAADTTQVEAANGGSNGLEGRLLRAVKWDDDDNCPDLTTESNKIEPQEAQTLPMALQVQTGAQIEAAGAGEKDKEELKATPASTQVEPESPSPPTTVSELDQDEELSTPSFVDSYRNRLDQVCRLADSVAGDLLSECLADGGMPPASGAHEIATHDHQQQQQQRLASGSSLSSCSSTSSPASLPLQAAAAGGGPSGASSSSSSRSSSIAQPQLMRIDESQEEQQAKLEQSQLQQQSSCGPELSGGSQSSNAEEELDADRKRPQSVVATSRPKLPDKPAHLRAGPATHKDPEMSGRAAAAASAVTATSIAAAAALHSGGRVHELARSAREACPVVPATLARPPNEQESLSRGGNNEIPDDEASPAARAHSAAGGLEPPAAGSAAPTPKVAKKEQDLDGQRAGEPSGEKIVQQRRQSENNEADKRPLGRQDEPAIESESARPEVARRRSQARQPSLDSTGSKSDFGRRSSVGPAESGPALSSACSVDEPTETSEPTEQTTRPRKLSSQRSTTDSSASFSRSVSIHSAALESSNEPTDEKEQPRPTIGQSLPTDSAHLVDLDDEQPQANVYSRQQSSNELSTVSEASEELTDYNNNNNNASQSSRSRKNQGKHSRGLSSSKDHEGEQPATVPTKEAPETPTRTQLDVTTEQDLASSECTLRSETGGLTLASERTDNANQASQSACPKSSVARKFDRQHSLESLQARRQNWASGEATSIPLHLPTSGGADGSQKRQSLGACGLGGARMSPTPPAIDCPYVHDIQPLVVQAVSPPSLASAGSAHVGRLSHDDTMEAIEDDVEGEEQEMKLLELQQSAQNNNNNHGDSLAIAPPVGFTSVQDLHGVGGNGNGNGCDSYTRVCTPAGDSIKEEDEDEVEEEDEESSISVSQKNGVVVQREVVRGRKSPPGSSSSNSSSPTTSPSSSSKSSSATSKSSCTHSNSKRSDREPLQSPDNQHHEEDDGEKTPVKLAPPGADDKSKQLHKIGSSSTESGTHAILEHFSRHHQDICPLEEPLPGLEKSRSISAETQMRRESWRRESSSSGKQRSPQTIITQVPLKDEPDKEMNPTEKGYEMFDSEAGDSSSRTGTMKRRRPKVEDETNESAPSESQPIAKDSGEPTTSASDPLDSSKQRRGPPLGQLKQQMAGKESNQQTTSNKQTGGPKAETAGQKVAHSSSIDRTDTSICSSCSCMEGNSFDQTIAGSHPGHQQQQQQQQQQPAIVTTEAVACEAAPTVASSAPTSSAVVKQQQTWMSQEEGTVFTENYWLSHWLYISEHEEAEIWRRSIDMTGQQQDQQPLELTSSQQEQVAGMPKDMTETGSTTSERSFSSRYKSTTRKMIHRRATIEMYKRIMSNKLKREKRVEISRSNGEFGFRIHGSRPVVVSAIERGTCAETCGLQVGDLIYAINGTNILDMAHSDVVRLAHNSESGALVLDLVPTNDFLRMSKYNRANNKRYEPTVTGFLMRLSPSTAQPLLVDLQEQMSRLPEASSQQRAARLTQVMRRAWRQRYFVLRSDNCLYWYKRPADVEPLGGINLQGFSATLTDEFSEPSYVIRLIRYGGQPHYLGTNNMCDIQTWIDAINKAATEANQNDPYMKRTLTLARTRPNKISEPDCCGWLYKFSHKRAGGAHWRAAYFVLKDACLYLFRDQRDDVVGQASAVYYLHGYRVRSKHIENKRHTFELIPPNRKTIRPMFLMATNEIDKKRWIAALEYSIDRWIEIG